VKRLTPGLFLGAALVACAGAAAGPEGTAPPPPAFPAAVSGAAPPGPSRISPTPPRDAGTDAGTDAGLPSLSEMTGEIAPEDSERVMRAHARYVNACFMREYQRNPTLAVRFVLELWINGAGRVLAARAIQRGSPDAAVEACILRNAREWRFPAPQGGPAMVHVMIRFPHFG